MQMHKMCKTISESQRKIVPRKCAPAQIFVIVADVRVGLLSRSSLKVKKWSLMKVQNGHLLEALAFRSMIAEQVLFLSLTSRNKE